MSSIFLSIGTIIGGITVHCKFKREWNKTWVSPLERRTVSFSVTKECTYCNGSRWNNARGLPSSLSCHAPLIGSHIPPHFGGAYYRNAHITKMHLIHRQLNCTAIITQNTDKAAQSEIGLHVNEAVKYAGKTPPDATVTAVAHQFAVSRWRLKRGFHGIHPKARRPAVNTKLSREGETVVYRFVDGLDSSSFAVRPELVMDAANYILKERSSSNEAAIPPSVSKV